MKFLAAVSEEYEELITRQSQEEQTLFQEMISGAEVSGGCLVS